MKRIAIIDDEPLARQLLRTLVTTLCPDVQICGEAESVESAYVMIRQTRPHALLLDVLMKDGTGFDLLDRFPRFYFQVIFTTAHEDFALKAFRYHALDYLLKPIHPVLLAQAIDRVSGDIPGDHPAGMPTLFGSVRTHYRGRLMLTSQEGIAFLRLDQLVHLGSDGSYTTFYLMDRERHVVSRPMRDFEEMLPEEEFFKLHQSHIINLLFVKKILREEGGYALMEDGCKVPIARRRKDEFLDVIRRRFPGRVP